MNIYLVLTAPCYKLWLFHQIISLACMTNATLLHFWCPHSISKNSCCKNECACCIWNKSKCLLGLDASSWQNILIWCTLGFFSRLGSSDYQVRLIWCCFVMMSVAVVCSYILGMEWPHQNDVWCLFQINETKLYPGAHQQILF